MPGTGTGDGDKGGAYSLESLGSPAEMLNTFSHWEECALKEMPLVVRKRLSKNSKVKDLCLVKTNFLLLSGREDF